MGRGNRTQGAREIFIYYYTTNLLAVLHEQFLYDFPRYEILDVDGERLRKMERNVAKGHDRRQVRLALGPEIKGLMGLDLIEGEGLRLNTYLIWVRV